MAAITSVSDNWSILGTTTRNEREMPVLVLAAAGRPPPAPKTTTPPSSSPSAERSLMRIPRGSIFSPAISSLFNAPVILRTAPSYFVVASAISSASPAACNSISNRSGLAGASPLPLTVMDRSSAYKAEHKPKTTMSASNAL